MRTAKHIVTVGIMRETAHDCEGVAEVAAQKR